MPLSEFNNVLLDGLQFCSKVYALFEKIRQEEGGVSKLRLRKSNVEKRLIEELLPLCKYIQTKYREGRYISIKWVNGSQKFDAEIQQRAAYIDQGYFPKLSYLEVTCAMHKNEYLSREHLDKEGWALGLEGIKRLPTREIISEPTCHSNSDFIVSFSKTVMDQINKKTANTYPTNTTLIIQCSLNTLYYPNEWEMLISELKRDIQEHNFQEIFIFDAVFGYFSSIYNKSI